MMMMILMMVVMVMVCASPQHTAQNTHLASGPHAIGPLMRAVPPSH